MSYLKEERETVIITDEYEHGWKLCTSQTKVIRKMEKVGIKPIRTEVESASTIYAEYVFPYKQLSFRKLTQLTDKVKSNRASMAKGLNKK